MDYKVIKMDLNTKLQYYFLSCIFPLSILRVFDKIPNISEQIILASSIIISILIIYFIFTLNMRCSTFLVINENALQVCRKQNGKVKKLNEIKRVDIKSVGYMSSSILATTKDKKRVYMMNIFPPILAVFSCLNALVIFTFLFKFLLFQSQLLNELNSILGFDYKKRNIFVKIFDFLINFFFWFCLIFNLFLVIAFLLESISKLSF